MKKAKPLEVALMAVLSLAAAYLLLSLIHI